MSAVARVEDAFAVGATEFRDKTLLDLLTIALRSKYRQIVPPDERAVFTTSLGAEDMVVVELQQPLPLADFSINRVGGALIVVDPATHRTSGALLVRGV